jgi:hypothetical protein
MTTINKLKNIRLIAITIIAIVALASCKTKMSTSSHKEDASKYASHIKGTILKTELDGCTYTIVLEDKKRLEPVNLPDEFKVDSLPVWIQYKHHDGFSICMMGEMVDITSIVKREK